MEKAMSRERVVFALDTATSGEELAVSLRLSVGQLVDILVNGLREKREAEELDAWMNEFLAENLELDLYRD